MAIEDPKIKRLTDMIRQTGFEIHSYLGTGHFEKVYENALAHRLRKAGLNVRTQVCIQVRDEDGTILGEYFADMLVEESILVELKVARDLAPEHKAQLLGYMRGARVPHGMLLNFGSFPYQVRKYILEPHMHHAEETRIDPS